MTTSTMQHPLPCPPFVDVEGVVNIRSVGRYTTTAGRAVKPNIIYRSGDVSSITERGRKQFSELGVHIVFDFRADAEIKDFDSSTPPIEGVKMIRTPAGIQRAFDPVSVAMRLKHWEENELEAFLSLYEEILETGKDAFKTVFLHLRDHPEEPCLVHCTAGKDRTGIFTTLLLLILGVEDRHIVDEYALTTIGLEPALPMLTRKMEKVAVYRENWKGMQNMGSSKPETMTAVLAIDSNEVRRSRRIL